MQHSSAFNTGQPEDDAAAPTPSKTTAGGTRCRRKFDRQPIRRPAWLFEFTSGMTASSPIACETHDISRGGVSVYTRRMLHTGRIVCLRLDPMGATGEPKLLVGIVKACRYDDHGLYIAGIQFETPKSDARLQSWLREQLRSAPPEPHGL